MLRSVSVFILLQLIFSSTARSEKYPGATFFPKSSVLLQRIPQGTDSDTITHTVKSRLTLVTGAHIGLWTGTFFALNQAWYADYARSSFHFFNDNSEWLQMDKAGHVWTCYQMSRLSAEAWKWAGFSNQKSALLGGISGIAYQSIIEIQDGFSSAWGFSWGDMTANVIGAAGFVLQQTGWKDQRIQVKLSYWPYDYSVSLKDRRNQLFGGSLPERILKDYNSQTYWISANLKSFFPDSKIPAWLNLSAGYSADGMLGAVQNTWTDRNGQFHDRTDIERVRRWILSVDVDLTRIQTKSKFLKAVFGAFNMIKVPAPALELDSRGRFRGHPLYF